MKKFKEKILQLGKRKNCFIGLLLVALIAFGIVTGLNGSKSAKIEANAFTEEPAYKNLDLNGIRYTYQTSLNELRTSYNLLYDADSFLFSIVNDTESRTSIFLSQTSATNENNKESRQNNISYGIKFKFNNEVSNNNVIWDSTNSSETNVFDFENISNFNNLKSIYIDFDFLLNAFDNISQTRNGLMLQFIYIDNNFPKTEYGNSEYIYKNAKYFSYYVSSFINYEYLVPYYKNYQLANIVCSYDTKSASENCAYCSSLNKVKNQDSLSSDEGIYFTIENVKFINNSSANIISYNISGINDAEQIYRGNILLSKTKYDKELLTYYKNNFLNPDLTKTELTQGVGTAYFGGKFNNNNYVNNIYYNIRNTSWVYTTPKPIDSYPEPTIFNSLQNNVLFNYDGVNFENITINYNRQNQLVYLEDVNKLKINDPNYTGAGLSAQVEDVLYNVNYVGNIAEKEFNEKVQDDLTDLAKTTGLGAFIGLIFGLLFGNPALGAGIGGLVGFGFGIFPLLIDGLQAIFGYDKFTGLYDFFNKITEFFVNIVDSIFNFIFSIITNPFVLVLIVIVAIIYLVYWVKNR